MDMKLPNEPVEALPSPERAARKSELAAFEQYMPLVHKIATSIGRKVPPSVLREDITAAGTYGLIDALAKHTGPRDAKFLGYAAIRIKGAILDELRRQDWVSRRSRATMPEAVGAAVVRFEDLQQNGREIQAEAPSVCEVLDEKTRRERLVAAMALLPKREAEIIDRYYFHEVSFKEIASSMSVSHARVSQLHGRATATLKSILNTNELKRAA